MYNYILILLWMVLLLLVIQNNTFITNTQLENFSDNSNPPPIIYKDDSGSEMDHFVNPEPDPSSCDPAKDPLCKYANIFLNSDYN